MTDLGDVMPDADELRERVRVLEALVVAMGDKLLTLALHLARLAERKDVRA